MSGTKGKVVAITPKSSLVPAARTALRRWPIVSREAEARPLTHRPTSHVAMICPRLSSWRASGTGNSTCSSITLA